MAGRGAHDLNEAEAVHGRPLEWRRKTVIDRRRGGLARGLAGDRWQIDSDRTADVETPNRARRFAGAEHCQLVGGQIAVDVDQRHCRCRRNPKLASRKRNETGACFIDQVVPAGLTKGICGPRKRPRLPAKPLQWRKLLNRQVGTRASGRFHGSAPGIFLV